MKHYPTEFRAEAFALYRSRPDVTIRFAREPAEFRRVKPYWMKVIGGGKTTSKETSS